MGKIKEIISGVYDSHRFIISWAAVLLFFFVSFLHAGWDFALLHSIIVTLSMVVVSVVEGRVLVRYFLKRGRYFLFYILTFLFIVGVSALFIHVQISTLDIVQNMLPGIQKQDADIDWMTPFIVRTLIYLCVASISAITYLQRSEQETIRQTNELKIENLDMELRYLKSQINPHFLFNALNNIYSLVYTKDESAPESVLKLSEMLRYVMVDCQADTISLEKELKFIDNYVDFQMLKLEDKRNITFEKDVKNYGYMLPPMIFQPIVENSFKYSRIENDPDGFVSFLVRQDDDGLEFVAENTIKTSTNMLVPTSQKEGSGIGLKNVKKRLSLHYKDKFSFETTQNENRFKVVVKLLN